MLENNLSSYEETGSELILDVLDDQVNTDKTEEDTDDDEVHVSKSSPCIHHDYLIPHDVGTYNQNVEARVYLGCDCPKSNRSLKYSERSYMMKNDARQVKSNQGDDVCSICFRPIGHCFCSEALLLSKTSSSSHQKEQRCAVYSPSKKFYGCGCPKRRPSTADSNMDSVALLRTMSKIPLGIQSMEITPSFRNKCGCSKSLFRKLDYNPSTTSNISKEVPFVHTIGAELLKNRRCQFCSHFLEKCTCTSRRNRNETCRVCEKPIQSCLCSKKKLSQLKCTCGKKESKIGRIEEENKAMRERSKSKTSYTSLNKSKTVQPEIKNKNTVVQPKITKRNEIEKNGNEDKNKNTSLDAVMGQPVHDHDEKKENKMITNGKKPEGNEKIVDNRVQKKPKLDKIGENEKDTNVSKNAERDESEKQGNEIKNKNTSMDAVMSYPENDHEKEKENKIITNGKKPEENEKITNNRVQVEPKLDNNGEKEKNTNDKKNGKRDEIEKNGYENKKRNTSIDSVMSYPESNQDEKKDNKNMTNGKKTEENDNKVKIKPKLDRNGGNQEDTNDKITEKKKRKNYNSREINRKEVDPSQLPDINENGTTSKTNMEEPSISKESSPITPVEQKEETNSEALTLQNNLEPQLFEDVEKRNNGEEENVENNEKSDNIEEKPIVEEVIGAPKIIKDVYAANIPRNRGNTQKNGGERMPVQEKAFEKTFANKNFSSRFYMQNTMGARRNSTDDSETKNKIFDIFDDKNGKSDKDLTSRERSENQLKKQKSNAGKSIEKLTSKDVENNEQLTNTNINNEDILKEKKNAEEDIKNRRSSDENSSRSNINQRDISNDEINIIDDRENEGNAEEKSCTCYTDSGDLSGKNFLHNFQRHTQINVTICDGKNSCLIDDKRENKGSECKKLTIEILDRENLPLNANNVNGKKVSSYISEPPIGFRVSNTISDENELPTIGYRAINIDSPDELLMKENRGGKPVIPYLSEPTKGYKAINIDSPDELLMKDNGEGKGINPYTSELTMGYRAINMDSLELDELLMKDNREREAVNPYIFEPIIGYRAINMDSPDEMRMKDDIGGTQVIPYPSEPTKGYRAINMDIPDESHLQNENNKDENNSANNSHFPRKNLPGHCSRIPICKTRKNSTDGRICHCSTNTQRTKSFNKGQQCHIGMGDRSVLLQSSKLDAADSIREKPTENNGVERSASNLHLEEKPGEVNVPTKTCDCNLKSFPTAYRVELIKANRITENDLKDENLYSTEQNIVCQAFTEYLDCEQYPSFEPSSNEQRCYCDADINTDHQEKKTQGQQWMPTEICELCRQSQTGGTVEQDMIASYVTICSFEPQSPPQQFMIQTLLSQFAGYELGNNGSSSGGRLESQNAMRSIQIQTGLSYATECNGAQTVTALILTSPEEEIRGAVGMKDCLCGPDIPGIRTRVAMNLARAFPKEEKTNCNCNPSCPIQDEPDDGYQSSVRHNRPEDAATMSDGIRKRDKCIFIHVTSAQTDPCEPNLCIIRSAPEGMAQTEYKGDETKDKHAVINEKENKKFIFPQEDTESLRQIKFSMETFKSRTFDELFERDDISNDGFSTPLADHMDSLHAPDPQEKRENTRCVLDTCDYFKNIRNLDSQFGKQSTEAKIGPSGSELCQEREEYCKPRSKKVRISSSKTRCQVTQMESSPSCTKPFINIRNCSGIQTDGKYQTATSIDIIYNVSCDADTSTEELKETVKKEYCDKQVSTNEFQNTTSACQTTPMVKDEVKRIVTTTVIYEYCDGWCSPLDDEKEEVEGQGLIPSTSSGSPEEGKEDQKQSRNNELKECYDHTCPDLPKKSVEDKNSMALLSKKEICHDLKCPKMVVNTQLDEKDVLKLKMAMDRFIHVKPKSTDDS